MENMSFFEIVVISNVILFVLTLATSGELKKIIATACMINFLVGVAIICYHTYFKIPY